MSYEVDTPLGPAIQGPHGPVLLSKLFCLDAETGRLTWAHRVSEDFPHMPRIEHFNSRFAGKEALISVSASRGYRIGSVFSKEVRAHRIILALLHGEWPKGMVDHINGDRADNSLSNLRIVSPAENGRNARMPKRNTSGVVGVSWNTALGNWFGHIRFNGKTQYLGQFANKEDAIAARKAAEVRLGFHPNHGRT